MREILFRGKRVDNGEWIEGCYAEFVHGFDGYTKPGIQVTRCVPSVANRLTPTYETELVEVFPETVGQYTGMTDRNGNKIFEEDILEFDEYPGENYWLEIAKDEEPPHNFIVGYRKKPNANVQGISHGIFTILEDLPRGCKIISNTHDMED